MTAIAQEWKPTVVDGVRIGPANWDGRALVTEVAAKDNGRVYSIGPLEMLVLDAMREPGTVEEIRDRVESAVGVSVSVASVGRVVNTFVLHGLVNRPFQAVPEQLQAADRAACERAQPRPISFSADRGPLNTMGQACWKLARSVFAFPAALVVLALGAFTVATTAGSWHRIIGAARGLLNLPVPQLVMVIVGVLLWHMVSQLGHEICHGMAFVRLSSGRNPVLSVTSLGPVPMPATHLDGLGLINSKWRVLGVVMAGPVFTLGLSALPAWLATSSHNASVDSVWGGIALLVDLTIVVLSLSPFPNTDMTRGLEAITGTRQLPIAASRYRQGAKLPVSLPVITRTAVRGYPLVLLLAAITSVSWVVLVVRSLF